MPTADNRISHAGHFHSVSYIMHAHYVGPVGYTHRDCRACTHDTFFVGRNLTAPWWGQNAAYECFARCAHEHRAAERP